jgi:membrane protein YqaA with SNARE-associated domain
MESNTFDDESIFRYNQKHKLRFALFLFGGLFFFIGFILYYIFALKYSDFFAIRAINTLFSHITFHMKGLSLAGMVYTGFFGGLFFLTVPMEVVFVAFLRAGHSPILLIPLYLLGMIFSYTANYYIGFHLNHVSKKIITPQKFYKLKGLVNKYGTLGIFGLNALPLPSQILSTILGVFKYNIHKFYFYFIAGQLLKYVIISIGYYTIF